MGIFPGLPASQSRTDYSYSPQTLAYIMGRLRVDHSHRMDASTTHRLS